MGKVITAAVSVVAIAIGAWWWPSQGEYGRALWIWDPSKILAFQTERDKLFVLCQELNLSTLWIQVAPDEDGHLENAGQWRLFIAQANDYGVAIHALHGQPEWAISRNHREPRDVLEAIIRFNNASTDKEKFAGVHYDIEPYILPEWHRRDRRADLLQQYLALLDVLATRAAQVGLRFGVDIPFWWDLPDPDDPSVAITDVSFRGTTKSTTQHLVEMLDNIGLMNYRDRAIVEDAEVPDGIIPHGERLLGYADAARSNGHTVEVIIGVETFFEEADFWLAPGLPVDAFERVTQADDPESWFPASIHHPDCRTKILDERELYSWWLTKDRVNRRHVGIQLNRGGCVDDVLAEAKRIIMERYSAMANGFDQDFVEQELLRKINGDDEEQPHPNEHWRDARPLDDGGVEIRRVMLSSTTFADDTFEVLNQELDKAEDRFADYSSYVGIAFHYDEAIRELMD